MGGSALALDPRRLTARRLNPMAEQRKCNRAAWPSDIDKNVLPPCAAMTDARKLNLYSLADGMVVDCEFLRHPKCKLRRIPRTARLQLRRFTHPAKGQDGVERLFSLRHVLYGLWACLVLEDRLCTRSRRCEGFSAPECR